MKKLVLILFMAATGTQFMVQHVSENYNHHSKTSAAIEALLNIGAA